MLKQIIEKFLCKHEWFSHDKKIYEWTETKIIEGTEHWFKPKFETFEMENIVEILICKKCGKIHKIDL